MPIERYWRVEDRVIQIIYVGDTNLEETRVLFTDLVAMLDTSEVETVHVLFRLGEAGQTANVIADLRKIIARYAHHPRLGWSVLYGSNKPIQKFLATMLAQIFNIKMRMVETEAQAIAFLQGIESTLVIPSDSDKS